MDEPARAPLVATVTTAGASFGGLAIWREPTLIEPQPPREYLIAIRNTRALLTANEARNLADWILDDLRATE